MSSSPAAPAPSDRHRVGILVLGMHRSGTSALTWLLGEMGAALPRDPLAATDENSKGYWESQALVAADEALVRAARSSWFDPRALDPSRVPPSLLAERMAAIDRAIDAGWGGATLLAIKDPRICRFVPSFAERLGRAGIAPRAVLMLRPAAEIAGSLLQRDRTTVAYGQLLWLRHMLDAERDTRDLPRAVVRYHDLLRDWRGVAARVAPLLGRDGWVPADGGAAIDAFLDPGLRHHRVGAAMALPAELADLVSAAERALDALADADTADARAALDRVGARLAAAPWLEGDVVHDELRHRRAPATAPDTPAPPAQPACVPPPPPPAPAPPPDPTGDAALIRGSGLFDADWYRATYPEAAQGDLDPVDHYLREGAARGYRPNPLFDTGYYARQMARRRQGDAR